MHELVSHSSMLVAVHESGNAMQCSSKEHRDIFSSLLKGDGEGAAHAMHAHLSLIETRLKPRPPAAAHDAVALLRELWTESFAAAERRECQI